MSSLTENPTVSVVCATYNGAAWVQATIDSVIAQSFTDWEMIIVDDCSSDDTRALLASQTDPRIRVILAEENRGPVHSRNRAMAAARGRFIAGLDQDDLCKPDRLARQVAYLDAHPDTVLVTAAADLLEAGRVKPHRTRRRTSPDLIDWMMQTRNELVWSTVLFRSEVARRLDPITRPDRLYAEDFDFYFRMRQFGRIARIDTPLLLYRVHPGGASQRFTDTVERSAALVLAEAHRRTFGSRTEAAVALLINYVLGKRAAPDVQTLVGLFAVILAIRDAHFATARPSTRVRVAINQDIATLWRDSCRAAQRSGAIPSATRIAPPIALETSRVDFGGLMNWAVGHARRARGKLLHPST